MRVVHWHRYTCAATDTPLLIILFDLTGFLEILVDSRFENT